MYTITPITSIKKDIEVPADKSISHRAVLTSSLAKGKTIISPFLLSDDTYATLECIKKCGVRTKLEGNTLVIEGVGKNLPVTGNIEFFAKESGTTIRIFSGVLCGQAEAYFKFNTSAALSRRPMSRITVPLRMMGADIKGTVLNNVEYPPLTISSSKLLNPIKYKMPVASAQVKSAIIYASLYAKGITEIKEPFLCRDHTERMITVFGGKVHKKGRTIFSQGESRLISPGKLFIPSDFSSAAFFIVLGLILRKSQLLIKNTNINPTRCGLLTVLRRMGAQIKVVNKNDYYEPSADILVKSSQLRAVEVKSCEVPLMIDEIPILAVAASFAKGITAIWGAKELKVKETDRINSMIYNLNKAGVEISSSKYMKGKTENWVIKIKGSNKLKPAKFKSFSDHRTAMSMIVLAKALDGDSMIDDIACINKSFPEFISLMEALSA
ncbi:MAG: 3-phosphoshikimate 1-carboxyvinyltransferase [Candidatus Omnitrophota bacterium]|nr:3-phosphoshikimate 1-carboxyvinyltransferase [Candidatus Omnitrophota bacterium]